jgi:hypothetical protein
MHLMVFKTKKELYQALILAVDVVEKGAKLDNESEVEFIVTSAPSDRADISIQIF